MRARNANHASHRSRALAALVCALLLALPAAAQDFGFGEENAAEAPAPAASGARVGGKIEFSGTTFIDPDAAVRDMSVSALAAGKLDFKAKGGAVDSFLRLKLSEKVLRESPESVVDQVSLRLFSGPLVLEGGLLKLTWGKADSQGPLDVLNPLDLSDLTVTDSLERKIARPMLRASVALGANANLELVGLAGFKGNRFAFDGVWASKTIVDRKTQAYNGFYYGTNPAANHGRGDGLYASYYGSAFAAAYSGSYAEAYQTAYQTAYATAYAANGGNAAAAQASALTAVGGQNAAITLQSLQAANTKITAQTSLIAAQAKAAAEAKVAGMLQYPDTDSLKWSQGGARLTGSVAGFDLGLQYFYGYLPNPVASADPALAAANGGVIVLDYNRYHQVGADLATVLALFNLRAEAAANLTDDMDGKDPLVYNPNLAWSLGFDRELFSATTLNVQGSGSYRLFDEGVNAKAYDIEKGTDLTRTRITAYLSRKFLKDKLELKVAGVYGIEDQDFLVTPSLDLAVGDATITLSGGWFGGDAAGELGQFAKSSYARAAIKYEF